MIMRTWGLAVLVLWGAVLATALAAPSESIGSTSGAGIAQGEQRTVWDGVYTADQAARGAALYDKECAGCHGPSGAGGGMAPALVGAAFSSNYDGLSVGDLFDRNRNTMPPGKEGQIGPQENADITAFMLRFNAFPPGSAELPSAGMVLKTIRYVSVRP
jgi:mono/diheme cytochrome c family protein